MVSRRLCIFLRRRWISWTILFSILTTSFYIYKSTHESIPELSFKLIRSLDSGSRDHFQESSNLNQSSGACRLPVLDPWHPSVKHLVEDLGKLECGTTHSSFENNTILVNANDGVSAKYYIINRPEGDDFSRKLSEPFSIPNQVADSEQGKGFKGSAYVNSDFVRVDIKQNGGKPDITEVHMQTAPKPDVLKRTVKPAGIPVNIAMLMFDSTSAANFHRQMAKTQAYLKTRPTIYMKGNTIVGDGTTAQLCAMLTGIAEKDEPEARRSQPNSKVVDDWRWVFHDYRSHGYATMYSEDSPGYATFNYRLHGFKHPPTDHYGRYFWFEGERYRHHLQCAGNDAIHRITMKYFLSLFRTYKQNPKFAFLLFSELSHENINSIKYADEDLVKLMQTMEKENFLNDTIVFIFGDHGIRYGKMRATLQGKLEERLPHMSITFPTWFPDKHPNLYEAVQHNSQLLTTPFDIYATLQHILSYPLAPKGVDVGQSLFYRIDAKTRTCSTTGVEDHWCPCLNFESVSLDEAIVKQLVSMSVKYINKQLEREGSEVQSLCHKLTLKEIKSASREMPNDKVQKFKKTNPNKKCDSCEIVLGGKDENTLASDTVYQIQFITSPNDGFYEASIRVEKGKPTVKGSFSRIDEYGHQPDCIAHTFPNLRKFCLCKS